MIECCIEYYRHSERENLNLNKDECYIRCTSVPFGGVIISRQGKRPGPRKLKALTDMPFPKAKMILQVFCCVFIYLSKFCQATSEICEPLGWLMLVNAEWLNNGTYQTIIQQSKGHHKRRHLHDILQWNKTFVPWDRCIWSKIGSQVTTDQQWNELASRQSNPQQHFNTNYIHEQKCIKCWKRYNNIERSIRDTA